MTPPIPPPPAWSWLPSLSAMQDLSTVLLHVSAIAQTAFVILWCTLPWWRVWIGRALMVKSTALMLFLDFALLVHYAAPAWWQPYASTALFGLVTLGILSQVIALPYEMVTANHESRRVSGAPRARSDTPPDAMDRDAPALR